MSLINEALKRTRDASYQISPRPAMSGTTTHAHPARFSSFTALLSTAVVVLLAALGTRMLTSRVATHVAAVSEAFESAPPQVPSEVPVQAPVVQVPEPPAADAKKTSDDPPATEAAVSPAPEPELPKLTLQGITSEAEVFEAMINDVNLREGDEIEGARVVSINSRRVQLKFGEREILLRLR
jgi:hypothetical protein